jgi:hypothetical protein
MESHVSNNRQLVRGKNLLKGIVTSFPCLAVRFCTFGRARGEYHGAPAYILERRLAVLGEEQ